MIIDANLENVYGIILGNCIFGNKNAAVGKYFNHQFWDKDGKIMGTVNHQNVLKDIETPPHFEAQAWSLVMNIKDHQDFWITERKTWSSKNVAEVLSELLVAI